MIVQGTRWPLQPFHDFFDLFGPRVGWLFVSLVLGYVCRWAVGLLSAQYVQKRSHLPGYNYKPTTVFGWRTQFLFTMIALHFTLPRMGYEQATANGIAHWIEVGIIIGGWAFFSRVFRIIQWIAFVRFDMSHPDNLVARKAQTQVHYLQEVAQVALGFICLCLILMSFESARRFGSSLMASAGLAGIVIGFAAQRFLSSVIAGLQVAFTQPLRIDDVVIVEGEWGWVKEISLTYIVVETWDHRSLVVPMTYFVEKPFQNWTRTEAELFGTIIIYADYALPVQTFRQKFEEVLHASPLWDGKVGKIHVTDATEKSMQLRALVSARNAGEVFELRCYVREELIQYIQTQSPDCLPKSRVSTVESRRAAENGEAA